MRMDSCVPYIKYFMENYIADPLFREQMQERPHETLQEHGLLLDAEMALDACARIHGLARERRLPDGQNRYIQEYQVYVRRIMREYEGKVSEEAFADRDLFLWNRQVHKRCRMENRRIRRNEAVHYFPLLFELSDGCSVQCPFCGVDAPAWSGNFAYTPENAELWREILKASVRYLGRAAGAGSCYMASEPMDNPDYEKFVFDFREITGSVPQTTTAVAERCPERIRAFMKELGDDAVGKAALRFSVRNLRQLEKIQEIYTLDELKDIELLTNNPESLSQYSLSGRSIRLCARMGKKGSEKFYRYGICCVAGLRVNMVKRTMDFIEPELPSERFPNGFRIRETLTFEDAKEFEEGMRRLFGTWAVPELPEDRPLCLNDVCVVREKENSIEFWGDGVGCSLEKDENFRQAVGMIRARPAALETVRREIGAEGGRALSLWQKFQYLYERGYVRMA